MLSIGLTGGIGSGKTTVAHFFADLGVDIIDTDLIARAVVEPGTTAFKKIAEHFGVDILNADQTLNRKMLAKKIFNNSAEKYWLEQLLHPLIRSEVTAAKTDVNSQYCIVVIPLLVETLPNPDIDRILVVDSPKPLQFSRTQTRDQLSESEISAIIAFQATAEERLAAADDIIINDGSLEKLRTAVTELHKKYLRMSAQKNESK
jgi:dephospho-CoA kinase